MMTDVGLQDASFYIAQSAHLISKQLQHPQQQAEDVTDSVHAGQPSRQQPVIRSPTSTLAEEDVITKSDAAAMAAAYRARIALAAASPASTAPPGNQPRATPAARLLTFVNSPIPTPTVHGNDQNNITVLERKWKTLYGDLKGNTQAAADVLMKQAQCTSQLEELAQALFIQLKASTEDRARLQQLLLQERAQLMAHVESSQQLQQRLLKSEHRSTAVQVVTESLQSQLGQAHDALEASNQERQQLADQVKQLAQQLAVTTECRTRGDALIAEQTAIIEALRQQLETQASSMSSLAEDKAQLEAQLQGVLQAEQELTVHLRETHAAIEGQLAALRDQLKAERQKRAAVVKRRGELQAQVEALQTQLAAQQADMASLTDKLGGRGGSTHPAPSRPAAATGHVVASSAARPSGSQAGLHPRASGAASATPHGRGPTHAASLTATAAASAHQRPRSSVRSSSPAAPNPRVTSHSPATSGGGGAGRPSAQRRTSSPNGVTLPPEDAAAGAGEPATAAAVTLHVPSSLQSPEASFSGTPVPTTLVSRSVHEEESPGQFAGRLDDVPLMAVTPAHTRTVVQPGAGVEPLSPPIAIMTMSARESSGLESELGGKNGANRRRSVSPDGSALPASSNAVQHARRVVSTGRPAGARSASPAPASSGSTWLP